MFSLPGTQQLGSAERALETDRQFVWRVLCLSPVTPCDSMDARVAVE